MNQTSGKDKNSPENRDYLFEFEAISENSKGNMKGETKERIRSRKDSPVSPELIELTDRLNQFLIDIVNLKYELLKERKEKEEINKKYKELKERFDELDRVVQSERQEIQFLSGRIRSLELQNHTLSVQLSEKEEELERERKTKQKVYELLGEREEKLGELSAKIVEKEKDIESFGKKLQKLSGELSNALVMIGNLEETKKELSERINLYESKLRNVREELNKKEEIIGKIRDENLELNTELKSLQELVETQQGIIESLSRDKDKLIEKLRGFEKELKVKSLELEKEIAKRKALEVKQEEVLKETARLIGRLDTLSKEKDRCEKEIRSLREKNLNLQKSVEYWETQVKQLKINSEWISTGEVLKHRSVDKRLWIAYYSLPESGRDLLNVLLYAGFINEEQNKKIQALVCSEAVDVEHYLIENGIVEEEVVYMGLSVVNSIPYVYLQLEDVDTATLSFLGVNYCINRLTVPLKTRGEILLLAMADPRNRSVLDEVGRKSSRSVLGVYASPSVIIGILEEFMIEGR